ncbi:MAG TPA: protein kinase [Friedmanniella sp.]
MPSEPLDDALGAFYVLEERIGRGATGEVWRGVDRRSGAVVAAKVLHPEHLEDRSLVERFVRERSILVGLRHPNVVSVQDLVVEGERLAIVMELVGGGSLRDTLRERGPLRPAVALRVVAAVLDGLAAAHDRHVLHRDLKPDNVLLASAWQYLGPGAVKLSDFGIAEIVADDATGRAGIVGTPEYLAPEQLVTGTADLPSDVYSAGILLYELLGGRTPFAGPGTGDEIARRHVTSEVPRLPVPDPVWEAIAGMLAKDPARRPTARVAAAQLRRVAPTASDLAALPAQERPDGFASAGGPATEVRGLIVPAPDTVPATTGGTGAAGPQAAGPTAAGPAEPAPDLGTPGQATMLRSMPTLPTEAVARPSDEPAERALPAWLRSRRAITLVCVGAVLVVLGVVWIVHATAGRTPAATQSGAPASAQQQSTVLASGLGVSRTATWDPSQRTATLSITYATQSAPLTGPFLEVVPGLAGQGCPPLQWQDGSARPNVASVTGFDTACAWAVSLPQIQARSSTTVSAELPLDLSGSDPAAALQEWLDGAAAATDAAVSDAQVTSTAYVAQRLTDIQVVAPDRTVSGQTLRLTLVPVWPSGADALHPLFRSPPSGEPAQALVAVAGGTAGVRFSDSCSGALSISDDGLVVVAQSVAQDCRVGARVGNFTDPVSSPFEIATRGS